MSSPPAPPPLLCDRMLGGLARWLRAAGHDTAAAGARERDGAILSRCRLEDRTLVSRDRDLVETARRGGLAAVWIGPEDTEAQALALARELELDWAFAPFTRCMMDNTPLVGAGEAEMARVPERSRALPGPFRACPACGRVFWPGSHVRRMQARLARWKDLAGGDSPAPGG